VVPSHVVRYRGREIDPQTLGRELQVRAVLTGKYVERGSNLIISVELSDTRDNHHIWGEQYNRNLVDIAAVQEEISRQIADMLRLKLTNEQRQRIAKKYTDNPDAYQLYLKGLHYQLKDTPEGLTKSSAVLRASHRCRSELCARLCGPIRVLRFHDVLWRNFS
jgi:hypothetical protein